jgi:hypothetical protein
MKKGCCCQFFIIVHIMIIILISLSSSCNQQLSLIFPLRGRVLDSIGGAPVPDACVEVEGTEHVTRTDSAGFFQFDAIDIGLYDIVVTKPGRAGSRLQEVYVCNDDVEVEIVQYEYNYLPEAVTPPSISVKGIQREGEYNRIVPIDVQVEAGSCPVFATEFHRSIYLKIGTTSMSFYEEAESATDTLSYLWNTRTLPPGQAIIKVVAYDTNNNRSELNIPVFITFRTGSVPGLVPFEDFYTIIATTYSQSMDITRVPEDTTIIVEFMVQKYYSGIVIYSSLAEEGPYSPVGQTTYSDTYYYKFVDYSPSLEPDMTVYYKMAYFNQYGTGPFTGAISVRILPKYSLSLVSPENNANITDTTPTLTWTCAPFLDDANRTDWIIASNVLDATIVAYSFVSNQTEITLPELLYNNKYEWDVRSFYEYNNSPPKANVLSRSFPRGKGSNDFSLNGAFYFTVMQPED